jgi:hypothetical protein
VDPAKQAALTRFFCMASSTFAWFRSAVSSMARKRPSSAERICSP